MTAYRFGQLQFDLATPFLRVRFRTSSFFRLSGVGGDCIRFDLSFFGFFGTGITGTLKKPEKENFNERNKRIRSFLLLTRAFFSPFGFQLG
jgi:hypothetical protein